LTAGTPSAAKRATSVHACFGSTTVTPAARSRATSGCDENVGADGLRSRKLTRARPATSASTSACAARSDVSGVKRWLRFSSNVSGTMLRPRPPEAIVAEVTFR